MMRKQRLQNLGTFFKEVESNETAFKSSLKPAQAEIEDDCIIVFDSAKEKTVQVSKINVDLSAVSFTNDGPKINGENSAVNVGFVSETDEECHVLFESTDKMRQGSVDICSGDASLREHMHKNFSTVDRQTRQIMSWYDDANIQLLNCKEVTLDFQPSRLHEILGNTTSRNCRLAKERKLLLQDVPIRSGKWSKQEDKILLRNWKKFVEEYQIDNPVLLLGLYRGKTNVFCKFTRAKKFLLQLGRDLDDRPLRSIYCRARQLLDMWNHKGRFSEEEKQKLLKLQKMYGSNWTRIALSIRRPAMLCSNAYKLIKKSHKKGVWTMQEDELLLKAVTKHVGKKRLLNKFRGLPWKKIASCVPGRNTDQCRNHWLKNLCWKAKSVDRPKWKKLDTALLLYLLYSDMVEEECYIDWDNLFEKFKTSAVSYVILQNHWHRLKCKVPDVAYKDHESIVIYLYRNYLPKILAKLNLHVSDLKCIKNRNSQLN